MKNDQSDSTQKSSAAEIEGFDQTLPAATSQPVSYNKKGEPPGQSAVPLRRQKSPTVRERSYSYFADANNEETRQVSEDEIENQSSRDAPSEPFLSVGDGYEQAQQQKAAEAAPKKPMEKPSVEDDEMLNTLYVGKYQLVSVIGSGGFGVIYLGHQVFLDRLVAIKMLKSNLASAKARIRFHQEGKAASALHHPVIVAINDFGIDELDRPYMVMEYVEGVTLSEVIRERITLNISEAMPIFLELLDGLAAAHSKGIVHRDIKPANIMLTMGEDGVHVKLLDFGIAKLLDEEDHTVQSLTKTGEALGTPLYMSPEQIQSFKIDYRSDLYSLGCVMFSCLTGAPPFVGEQKFMTMDKHLSEKPLSLKEASLGLDFPPELEEVVAKLLAKQPKDRYQSADEVRNILLALSRKLGLLPEGAGDVMNANPGGASGAIRFPTSVVELVSQGSSSGSGKAGAKTEIDAPSTRLGSSTSAPKLSREEQTRAYTIHEEKKSASLEKTEFDKKPTGFHALRNNQTATGTGSQKQLPHDLGESLDNQDEDDDGEGGIEFSGRSKARVAAVTLALLGLVSAAGFVGFYLLKPAAKVKQAVSVVAVPPVLAPDAVPPKSVITDTVIPDGSDDEQAISVLSHSKYLEHWDAGTDHDLTDAVMPEIGQLRDLKELRLRDTKITNDGLVFLRGLPIEILSLRHTKINSFGLKHLTTAKLPKLACLYIGATDVSDRNMNLLGSMSLITLQLSKTQVTESGIKVLSESKQLPVTLKSLELDDCNVGNSVVPMLIAFPRLSSLSLNNTRIDPKCFPDLVKLRGLTVLSLADNKKIADEDLRELTKMEQLITLDLSHTNVTAAGLRHLQKLKHLTHLYLTGLETNAYFTQQLESFKKAVPGCTVETMSPRPSFF